MDRENLIDALALIAWNSEPKNAQTITEVISLLKEQEEKLLRCDKCSYHREDGWCGMHGRWVKEADYCSFGAWKGREVK